MPAATDRQTDVGGDLAARVAALGTADVHRLRRRLQGAGRIDDARAPREHAGDHRPRRHRRRGAPRAPPRVGARRLVPRRAADQRARRRHPRGPREPPGGRRGGRDRVGQDHAAAEDGARAGPRRARHDRPHPAAADRGAHGRRTRRRGARHHRHRHVGYQVRFTSRASEDTLVKFMTDGILLAEIQQDRMLRRYDTLIIDEAHERSLNIDFLLGYLPSCCRAAPTSRSSSPRRRSTRSGSRGTSATRRSSRSRAAPIPSRSATGRWWTDEGRPARPGRRHRRRGRRAAPGRSVGRRARLPVRRAGDPRRRRRPARARARPMSRTSTSSPSTRACRPPSSTASSSRRPAADDASCSRRTSPRPR